MQTEFFFRFRNTSNVSHSDSNGDAIRLIQSIFCDLQHDVLPKLCDHLQSTFFHGIRVYFFFFFVKAEMSFSQLLYFISFYSTLRGAKVNYFLFFTKFFTLFRNFTFAFGLYPHYHLENHQSGGDRNNHPFSRRNTHSSDRNYDVDPAVKHIQNAFRL